MRSGIATEEEAHRENQVGSEEGGEKQLKIDVFKLIYVVLGPNPKKKKEKRKC